MVVSMNIVMKSTLLETSDLDETETFQNLHYHFQENLLKLIQILIPFSHNQLF